jgi:hypothetical protein
MLTAEAQPLGLLKSGYFLHTLKVTRLFTVAMDGSSAGKTCLHSAARCQPSIPHGSDFKIQQPNRFSAL